MERQIARRGRNASQIVQLCGSNGFPIYSKFAFAGLDMCDVEPGTIFMAISATTSAAPARRWSGLLPLLTGAGVYVLLLGAGNLLLRDTDTYWQVTIGQWIIDNRTVPTVDVYSWTMRGQPWISTQWLAQVLLAASVTLAGWTGPVVLAAAAIATTFALLARFIGQRLAATPTLVLLCAALALMVPHLLARPHVLAMPVMVGFVGGLVAAMDRRGTPSLWLLPLMALWANLHGGFVLGLALIGAGALDVVWHARPDVRLSLFLKWFAFGLAALIAACLTPYGWESLLAARRILNLGQALALIGEWRAANFGDPGPLELIVLGGIGLALWRGVTLPPMRIVLVLGFVLMALGHVRNAEVLALLAPLMLAAPLAAQIGYSDGDIGPSRMTLAGLILILVSGTFMFASAHPFQPHVSGSPVAAVQELKRLGVTRVLNDYDFGGYLIANGVAPYIDGRTELYGEAMMVAHNNFSGAAKPDDLFRLLADERVEATLLRKQSAATTLLDHLDGWRKVYADDLAVIHRRDPDARHCAEPVLRSSLD